MRPYKFSYFKVKHIIIHNIFLANIYIHLVDELVELLSYRFEMIKFIRVGNDVIIKYATYCVLFNYIISHHYLFYIFNLLLGDFVSSPQGGYRYLPLIYYVLLHVCIYLFILLNIKI